MIQTAKILYNILSNASGVSSIVSNRISPVFLPKGTAFPALVYSAIDWQGTPTKDSNSRLDYETVQIDCLAITYSEVIDLADAVREALNIVTTGEYNGVTCHGIEFINAEAFLEHAAEFDGVLQISLDFKVCYSKIYGVPAVDYLLLEDGSFLLQEDGNKIIL